LTATVERELLTLKEVIAATGLYRDTVYKAVVRGEIPAVRIGRRWLVPRDFVAKMLTSKEVSNA
jgi:excisionase family DNA binding protein